MLPNGMINRICKHVDALFIDGPVAKMGTIPPSAAALMAWALQKSFDRTVVFITDGRQTLDRIHRDMETLSPTSTKNLPPLVYYPARETVLEAETTADPEITGYRLQALQQLNTHENSIGIVATCIQALLQPTLTVSTLATSSITLKKNEEIEIATLMHKFAKLGYDISFEVSSKGEACAKGGLIDIWPVTSLWPIRLEFFGPEIESIRMFNPSTQRSVGIIDEISIPVLNESILMNENSESKSCFLDHIPDGAIFFWADYDLIAIHAELLEESSGTDSSQASLFDFPYIKDRIDTTLDTKQLITSVETALSIEAVPLQFEALPDIPELKRDIFAPDVQEAARQKLIRNLCQPAKKSHKTIIYFETTGSANHFKKEVTPNVHSKLDLHTGVISSGFTAPKMGFTLVAESDIYGRRDTADQRYTPGFARNGPSKLPSTRITELSDIEPGDLVIHVEHGLGKYLGLFNIKMREKEQEVLSVEYADNTKLHIPVGQAHLLSRYVGVASHNTRLHTLGGKRWIKEKQSAQEAVIDIASSLIEMQAERSLLNGTPFPSDTKWQHEFEASFPYRETEDQITVIADTKQDMESERPMDRLICGDAGYGKTEVAIRASFKAVMSDKQVAVLVPTTILAQQHYDTFRERMAGYPIQIEMLSRFRTQKEKTRIIEDMQAGSLDIVIGTHALLQDRVKFSDLGLVIIDEEQRFGVVHKEKLKGLRHMVDVLTMTATPIPRTMYMSMTGARDISLMQSPPKERMAIDTIVTKNDDNIIRKALMRELNREGQAFFLHNRVATITKAYERLSKLIPEATMEVAHGQMPTAELETIMHRFTSGKIDILVCTTIIESGMDIPRANTIIIDRADRFGIAELYQLRGRVGRSNRKAYAYLLLPQHGHIEPDAQRRIEAVRKFSGLSAGYNLAMRDLEIRGAGNLLGASQSGHINAVG
ncbi:MAG: transcription-repair coupling factor, partial [Kiritimatiellae bacterium]|nr:transcription-repair coupling factor [Kiritimatiellia bacterium]